MDKTEKLKQYTDLSGSWWRSKLFKIYSFLAHPVTIFVGLQAICIAITVLWVVWFVDQNEAIQEVNNTFTSFQWDMSFGLTMLIVGCVLLGMLIVGTIFLFVFVQKQSNLIRTQKNFVSSVTHELRSPLSSIQLVFETLSTKKVPEEVTQEMYRMAGRDIQRLSNLVEQILLSARLDRGLHAGDEIEKFDLSEPVTEAINRIDHIAPNIQQRAQLELPDSMPIMGQKAVIRLLVGNLIENAIKYSPENSPILVRVKKEDKLFTLIEVKDQEHGLSKADCRKVFRMFHRAKLATKKAIPGTGLGLYIVRSLVKNLGGKTWAESNGVGHGASFFIRLPMDMSTAIRVHGGG